MALNIMQFRNFEMFPFEVLSVKNAADQEIITMKYLVGLNIMHFRNTADHEMISRVCTVK